MAYDSDTITALASGSLVVRDLLTVDGKTLAGAAAQFNYWTGEDNVAVNVPPLSGGSLVSRNYLGGATLLDVPAIVDAIGLEARSITLGLDHISSAAGSPMDMVYGNNVRVARVELHRGLFDPATWNLVSAPHLLFAGRMDGGAGVNDAAADGQGGLSLDAVSSAIDLTKTNPAMESDEQQRLRGDRFRRYGDTAGQIDRWWGMARGSAETNNAATSKKW